MHTDWLANDPIDDRFLDAGSTDTGPTTTIAATQDDQPSKSDGSQTYARVNNIDNDNLKIENEDEFAELDAWFASGAVEIL